MPSWSVAVHKTSWNVLKVQQNFTSTAQISNGLRRLCHAYNVCCKFVLCTISPSHWILFKRKKKRKENTATNTGCSQENTAACCSGLVEKRGCVLLSRPNLCHSLSAAGFIGHCCLMFINTALSAGVKSALEARFWQPSSRSARHCRAKLHFTLSPCGLLEGHAAVSQHPWWALDSPFLLSRFWGFELFSASTRILTFSLRFIGCLTRYRSSVFVASLAPTLSLLSVFYLTDSHFSNSLCPYVRVCNSSLRRWWAFDLICTVIKALNAVSTWSLSLIKWKKKPSLVIELAMLLFLMQQFIFPTLVFFPNAHTEAPQRPCS